MATTKAEAPERIWLRFDTFGMSWTFNPRENDTESIEYVRAGDLAPAGELVSREAAVKACHNERVDSDSTGDESDIAYNNACNDCAIAIGWLPALPPVARVPVAAIDAQMIATEIFVRCWPSEEPDTDTTIINAIATIIESHCGSVTPTQKDLD